jgi:hypothetical protein
VSRRCRPGRFKFMADSPPSTMTSNNSLLQRGHGANLGFLGLERNVQFRLPVC